MKEGLRGPAPKEIETPRENCALFGVVLEHPDPSIHEMLHYGLSAQQHRGQEAWGKIWLNKGRIAKQGDLGEITGIPEHKIENMLSQLPSVATTMGHLRYSAVGHCNQERGEKDPRKNIQPFLFKNRFPFAIAHNGTVWFDYKTREDEPDSDTYKVGKAISERNGNFENNVISVLSTLNGAYTFLFMTRDGLYVARDPWRIRPCVLGRIEGLNPGHIITSETVALRDIRAKIAGFPRRGIFAKVDSDGLHEIWRDPRVNQSPAAECSFEKSYFADDASEHEDGRANHDIRTALGRRLAKRLRLRGDSIVAVPDSGRSYAEGVSIQTGIPFVEAIQKNKKASRQFIQPKTPEERRASIFKKYRFIKSAIEGRKLIVVDDSIVRGQTTEYLVLALFQLGADRIHLLSGIPPVTDPCFWGIDFPDPNELVHNQLQDGTEEEFEKKLALHLVDGDKKLAKRFKISFQRIEDYTSIIQNLPHGTPVEHTGGCFHCVSGMAPRGTIVDFSQKIK